MKRVFCQVLKTNICSILFSKLKQGGQAWGGGGERSGRGKIKEEKK